MTRVGFEPTTHGLKVRCSTPELPGNRGFYTSKYLKKNKANLNRKELASINVSISTSQVTEIIRIVPRHRLI